MIYGFVIFFTICMPKFRQKIYHQCNKLIIIDKIFIIVYGKDEFLQEYRIAPDLECIKSIRLPVTSVRIRVRSIHLAYYYFHS